jgi:hypothetical protein
VKQLPAVVLKFENDRKFDFFELLAMCAFVLYHQHHAHLPGWRLLKGTSSERSER